MTGQAGKAVVATRGRSLSRKSLAALAVSGSVLAGCATGVPVERQVVVAGDRFTNVQGEAAFIVRTVLPVDENGARREVVGARCTVLSSLYQAELVTPARVVVPNFGPQSPQITVSCKAGALSGAGTARIVTRWDGPPPYPGLWGPRHGANLGTRLGAGLRGLGRLAGVWRLPGLGLPRPPRRDALKPSTATRWPISTSRSPTTTR